MHTSGRFSCEPPGRNLVDGLIQLRTAWETKASDAGAISKARRNDYADASLTCSHSEEGGVRWCRKIAKANLLTFCPTVQLCDLYLHLNVRNVLSDLSQLMESHGS